MMTSTGPRRESGKRSNLLWGDAGSSLVEVSLSLLLLLCVMLGIVAMARLAYAKHFVTFAARQGTRYASVRGSTFVAQPCSASAIYSCQATANDVSKVVKNQVPLGLLAANTTVTTIWPGIAGSGLNCLSLSGVNSPGCVVQVTVSYSFSFGVPFFPVSAFQLQSTSEAPILQ